jgi:hypothetical protein
MAHTLDDIQSRIAAVVDFDENTSNISTADYSLRKTYINQAQREWAELYDWQSLYRENNSVISTSTGNASLALPADFRKLAVEPIVAGERYPEVRPQDKGMFASTDKYVNVLGDDSTGKVMFINGALGSGASVMVPYYASLSSLVSPADVAMCPNPDFLVQRSLAWLWESEGDARYREAKVDADKVLKQLLEHEQTPGEGQDNRVYTAERKDFNSFRWGKS